MSCKLLRPPGSRLRRFSQLLFSRAANAAVFEPVLDQLRDEYFAALEADDLCRARLARARGYARFWAAAAGLAPRRLVQVLFALLLRIVLALLGMGW